MLLLSQTYTPALRRHSLLKKIQYASINWQIKKRVGLALWRLLFKGCRYEINSVQITIIAPNERVAGVISNRYTTPLERLFGVDINVESPANGKY